MGLHFWPTLALTVGGMMTSVFVFSGVGRAWMHIIKVFRKFGMGGIAFLTPILLSPIGGTVIATLLGVPRHRILLHMFWSAVFWGVALTFASIRFGHMFKH